MIVAGDTLPARLPPVAGCVDAEMMHISGSFDWLRAVTPCGMRRLWEDFRSVRCSGTPEFHYRDPGIDIAATRERLLDLPIREIEEPVFQALLAEKQRELDRQLELIELRGTDGFLQVSTDLFGTAAPELHADAMHILDVVAPDSGGSGQCVGASGVIEAALKQFDHYRSKSPDFSADVKRSADITAGLMVSNGTLLVSEDARIPRERLDALLHHEIGTHILTWHNGGHQPLRQLQCGLAHYDELQEGLGVLAEYLAGNLSPLRLRTLAARVIAVRLVTDGASFSEVFHELVSSHKFSGRSAFVIATRVFRGGGLTKDVVYLRGLKRLLAYLREGHPFEQLLMGKFALSQLPAIRKLAAAGWLQPPRLMPAYTHNAAAQRRLAECTEVPLDGLYQGLAA
jgi:uncharacterized protein (TIGR02421 family)